MVFLCSRGKTCLGNTHTVVLSTSFQFWGLVSVQEAPCQSTLHPDQFWLLGL